VSGSVRDALASASARLKEAGIASGARDARALMAGALGIGAERVTLMAEDSLPEAARIRFEGFVGQRLARKPVSRILARRMFWGREFVVSDHVLDARPETEILVAAALEEGPFRRVLDLGTGSGIIAVTLLAEWRDAVALATDISAEALDVAGMNATLAGVGRRLETLRSDWCELVGGRFDLIVSNPPYVTAGQFGDLAPEVRFHDPAVALTDGGDGLSAFRSIAKGLRRCLEPGGRVFVEVGPGQAVAVSGMFVDAGLDGVGVHRDLDGRDRVVSGRIKV